MTFEQVRAQAQDRWQEFESGPAGRVLVGAGTCGRAAGAGRVLSAVRDWLKEHDCAAPATEVGCIGLCYAEPLVEVDAPGMPRLLFGEVSPGDVPAILQACFVGGEVPESALAVMDGRGNDGLPAFEDLAMVRGQRRIVLRNCGLIDPENIEHYIARDGYRGLAKALQMEPEDVIAEVKQSGLRGRGGAGFPTGRKWQFARDADGERKYVICNADEGDPGAFMDRSVLESDPHSVVEGLTIAAYSVGAGEGYVYVRAEYPLAVRRLRLAIEAAEDLGLLGEDILGSGFDFSIKLKEGAGAFVCGEETALLASIEGRRGMPRSRPPFPAQEGLHGQPTNINNVETLANVPVILDRGGAWFSEVGTEDSPGTKTFALAGQIERTGLIEIPLGTTLRDIVIGIGGGVPEGRQIKAVQTGGPSGGCIPASMLDIPVEYKTLAEVGSIMGSGGMIVMDEDSCMVDIARYFVEFTQSESCGKCAPCRLGTRQMLNLLNKVCEGRAKPEDLEVLQDVARTVRVASLCGLGQTAPNPVLTTLEHYRDEYEEHVLNARCPAGQCPGLFRYQIDAEACTGCGACRKKCPADAVAGEPGEPHEVLAGECVLCGACMEACRFGAVTKV